MITEYHRPATLEEALKLIKRKNPETRPLGGGTVLSAPSSTQVAVVDLQKLKLNKISAKGKSITIGAAATMQALMDTEGVPAALVAAIRHDAAFNMRGVATVAGSLVSADGRSPFAVAMLALDAQLEMQPKDETIGYGDLIAMRSEKLRGKLITKITVSTTHKLSYQYVARTPADLPIIAVALAQWPSGRTRLALGGWGSAPVLAMDGKDSSGVTDALGNALSHASDQWASAEYRLEAGRALAQRAQAEVAA